VARAHADNLRQRPQRRQDERLTRADDALLIAEGEVGFTRDDREALLMVGMDVLGDRAAGHAAPVEADDAAVAVTRGCGELDGLAGGAVGSNSYDICASSRIVG